MVATPIIGSDIHTYIVYTVYISYRYIGVHLDQYHKGQQVATEELLLTNQISWYGDTFYQLSKPNIDIVQKKIAIFCDTQTWDS